MRNGWEGWHGLIANTLILRWFLTLPVVVALTMATVLATATSSWADIEPKRVLMLHSFGLRFKPWTDYAQFIRSGITRRSQTPVDFHDHSLLNARLADDKADGSVRGLSPRSLCR